MGSPIEDKYLCEIYYAVERNGYVRISELAKLLNVTAASVSRMAKKLKQSKRIEFERYGIITLTKKGHFEGKNLAAKHEILVQLYRCIGIEEEYIEKEVIRVENYISDYVIRKMEHFLKEE